MALTAGPRRARPLRRRAIAAACLAAAAAGACAPPEGPTPEAQAERFVSRAGARLGELESAHHRAAWVHEAFATDDTAAIAASASREWLDGAARLAQEAARHDARRLPAPLPRKLRLLRTGLPAVGPDDPARQRELSGVLAGMQRAYERSTACTVEGGACLDRADLTRLFAESRETDDRIDAWMGWRRAAAAGRPAYGRFVDLANAGARELGFGDTGAMWRSAWDMPPEALAADVDRVWEQVRPLYESLHCLVRGRLGETWGTAVAPPDEAIPAHLLGSPWGGQWTALYDLVRPARRDLWDELTGRLARQRIDAAGMLEHGERFFRSLGFPALPASLRERSLLAAPPGSAADCRAGAWRIDAGADVRVRLCGGASGGDYVAAHEALAGAHYAWAYRTEDPLFRRAAAPGFAEGLAGAVGLSMTPEYFVRAGILDRAPAGDDMGVLLRRALDTVAYVPFGLAVDRWRWDVFSGAVTPEAYNRSWWELRGAYQGLRPAAPRNGAAFDPGAAAPVAANTPTLPGVVARILQFQIHRALCEAAGVTDALHRCSIHGSPEAGARLREAMAAGARRPWPDTLAALTGAPRLDAAPLLDYFEPLAAWLERQNAGRSCGWPAAGLTTAANRDPGGSPPPRAPFPAGRAAPAG